VNTTLTRALAPFDIALRLAYFAMAPAVLVVLAARFPILGVVLNVALAVVVFAFASAFRRWVDRYPLLGKVLATQLRFEAFYREHPPKPFLFYVAYPLVLPYVFFHRVTRRELALYRGPSVVGLVLLLVGAGWDYYRNWQPEIPFKPFLGTWFAVILLQAIVATVLVMPLATTLIALNAQRRTGSLVLLLVAATLSMSASLLAVARKRHEVEQQPTRDRMYARTKAMPKRSDELRTAALRRALAFVRDGDGAVVKGARGTEIFGRPIEEARAILHALYLEDETRCFHLAKLPSDHGPLLFLFAVPGSKRKPIVWIASTSGGDLLRDDDELPDGALATLRRIAEH
jgi:hypothetical protein